MEPNAPNPYAWGSPPPAPRRRGNAGWWAAAISGAVVLVLAGVLVGRDLLPATNLNLARATATATAQLTTPASTATTSGCAAVTVLGLNGTPTISGGPPTITGTLVNGSQCLHYVDIKQGTGPAIQAGDNVIVNYTGWLSTGQQFDTSVGPGKSPFSVQNVGQAGVITGWNLGLIGMKARGERRLIIPPALGYGAGGYPPLIPGDETLIFDITVVSIK